MVRNRIIMAYLPLQPHEVLERPAGMGRSAGADRPQSTEPGDALAVVAWEGCDRGKYKAFPESKGLPATSGFLPPRNAFQMYRKDRAKTDTSCASPNTVGFCQLPSNLTNCSVTHGSEVEASVS